MLKCKTTMALSMDLNERITEAVHKELKERDWTQRQLAKQMSITESELSSVLSGRRSWTLRLIEAFHIATGCQVIIKGALVTTEHHD